MWCAVPLRLRHGNLRLVASRLGGAGHGTGRLFCPRAALLRLPCPCACSCRRLAVAVPGGLRGSRRASAADAPSSGMLCNDPAQPRRFRFSVSHRPRRLRFPAHFRACAALWQCSSFLLRALTWQPADGVCADLPPGKHRMIQQQRAIVNMGVLCASNDTKPPPRQLVCAVVWWAGVAAGLHQTRTPVRP